MLREFPVRVSSAMIAVRFVVIVMFEVKTQALARFSGQKWPETRASA
jgi:hypothetical protein